MFTTWLENDNELDDKVTGKIPEPLSDTVCVPLVSLIAKLPVWLPNTVGVKVTWIVQRAPAAKTLGERGQFDDWAKFPDVLMLLMVICVEPFLNVTAAGVLVAFNVHWPKLIFPGVTLCEKAAPAISKIVARHSAGRLRLTAAPPVCVPFVAHDAATCATQKPRAGAGKQENKTARETLFTQQPHTGDVRCLKTPEQASGGRIEVVESNQPARITLSNRRQRRCLQFRGQQLFSGTTLVLSDVVICGDYTSTRYSCNQKIGNNVVD